MTTRNAWWGLTLLLVGALLLAANLGYIAPFSVWDLWPILLLWPALKVAFRGISFSVEVDRGRNRHRWAIMPSLGYRLVALWVAAGAGAQLLHNLSVVRFDWGDVAYWTLPLLLVGIGLDLILRPRRRTWRWAHREELRHTASGTNAFVGDLRFGSRPWVFKSPMSVNLWAGDVDIDLTTAQFQPGDNYLALHAWAGEFCVRVPENMEVSVEAHCAAGQLQVFDERRDGISCDLRVTRPAAGLAAGRAAGPAAGEAAPARLFIGVDLTFGDVRVR